MIKQWKQLFTNFLGGLNGAELNLNTKVPKNYLDFYPDSPAKSSINLFFFKKNFVNLSKNLQKSHVIVDKYFAANTFITVESYSLINIDYIATVKTTAATQDNIGLHYQTV